MRLYFLRHGHAHALAPSDPERALSEIGHADVRRNIANIKNKLEDIEAVWVSPYRRAQETWAEARQALEWAPDAEIHPEIVPEGSVSTFITNLLEAKVNSVLVVTHQPFVGDAVEYLLGRRAHVQFIDTADIVALEVVDIAEPEAALLWHSKAGSK